MSANADMRQHLVQQTRLAVLNKAMTAHGLTLPGSAFPVSRDDAGGPEFLLNLPLKSALSEFARRSRTSLPAFVELIRGQTEADYRPNKSLVPAVLKELCAGYKHLDQLQDIARVGVEVTLKATPPRQVNRPSNHGSAQDRVNVLRKNIRKEQDAWRCLVLDLDLLEQWP
ncbi:hypothetical protein PR001_g32530, partial [Phytophthora rubi]